MDCTEQSPGCPGVAPDGPDPDRRSGAAVDVTPLADDVFDLLRALGAERDVDGPVGDLAAGVVLLDRLPRPAGVLVLRRRSLGEGQRDRPGPIVDLGHRGPARVPTLEVSGDED